MFGALEEGEAGRKGERGGGVAKTVKNGWWTR